MENITNLTPEIPVIFDKSKTNYLNLILISLGFVLFLASAYYLGRQSTKSVELPKLSETPNGLLPKTTNVPTTVETRSTPDFSQYGSIIIKPNSSNSNKSDIYFKNYDSGEEKFYLTINDRLYKEGNFYSYPYEFRQGFLYLLKDVGKNTELWKYDLSGNGTKLFSNSGNFKVSNNGKLIAILISVNNVVIVDEYGKTLHEYTNNQLIPSNNDNLGVDVFKWSADDKLFFGKISIAALTYGLFKINVNDWSFKVYDLSKLPIGMSMDINQDGDTLTFDNVPFMFDVDTANAFEKSSKKVNLYVYNLESNTSKIISTSIAKTFLPVWINANTVEFNNPNGLGRLTYSIN